MRGRGYEGDCEVFFFLHCCPCPQAKQESMGKANDGKGERGTAQKEIQNWKLGGEGNQFICSSKMREMGRGEGITQCMAGVT